MSGIIHGGGIIRQDTATIPAFDPAAIVQVDAYFDAHSLALSNGATVSTWNDLSGKARDMTSVAGTLTYTSSGIGNKGTVTLPLNAKMQSPVFQQFPNLCGTVILLSKPTTSAANRQLLGTYNQTAPSWLWYQTNGTVNHGFMGGTFFNGMGDADLLNRPTIQAWVRSGATLTHYDRFTASTLNTITNSQQTTGRLYLGDTGNGAAADVAAIIQIPTAATPQQLTNLFAGLSRRYFGGLPVHVDCCGDSITAGYTAGATPYPQQMEAKLGYRFGIYNLGVSGDGVSATVSRATIGADIYAARAVATSVFIGFVGTNDINGGMTAANAFAAYKAMFQGRPHDKKVAVTMLKRTEFISTPSLETARQSFNALLRAQWKDFANALAEPDLVSQLSDPSNATYFPDGVHCSTSGYDYLSTNIAAAVATLRL
jgi:lysophospholipase L1-like esterase